MEFIYEQHALNKATFLFLTTFSDFLHMYACCHAYVVELCLSITNFFPSNLPIFSSFPAFIFSLSAFINVFQVS